MTQKELHEAIKKCIWLSDNSGINLVGGICRGMCMPCKRVIKRGKCEMLIELSKKLRNGWRKEKDCKNCVNCCSIHGFMCTCRYSYDDGHYHIQVGQDVNRKRANKCDFYTTKQYDRDEFFVL